MTSAYPPGASVGLLVPQANPTVEADFRVLLPEGALVVASRMRSGRSTLSERLREYSAGMGTWLEAFGDMPLRAAGYACTASAYLLGPERESETAAEISDRRGHPVVTAFTAVQQALHGLGAERIGLVCPYPDAIAVACERAWRRAGFDVQTTQVIAASGSEGHPIYSLSAAAVTRAVQEMDQGPCDVVLLAGTGMPTLQTMVALGDASPPIVSSNLCLAWALSEVLALRGSDGAISEWVDPHARWRERLVVRPPGRRST